MLKIRVQGLPEEVAEFADALEAVGCVLELSEPYANRGWSRYVRVYIDAQKPAADPGSLAKKEGRAMSENEDVPLPDEELEWRREAERIAEMRRRARLRCPACGRAVADTVDEAREACLRDGLWHEGDDRVILCPSCKRERDEARERAHRVALEERRAALAAAAKEPVPRVEGPLPKTIVLDTETTGLHGWSDHLLTVGIVDGDGAEVASFKICPPAECCEWPEAERVNGIAPADTVAWPAIEDVRPELQRILDAAETVIGYNVGFDLEFLRHAGVALPDCEYVDVMALFAPVFGLRDDFHGGWRWQTLATAAAYVGHDWGAEGPHDALADCRATLAVLRWLEAHEGEEVGRREQGARRAAAWRRLDAAEAAKM
ncbi:exonuclease domain-containing protein [Ellagibacter sp.]|uniref:3'-5' exonuclease n=1 Tax=Ellagibacter sp. TaxID=2137578 RepID=UPI003AB1EFC1